MFENARRAAVLATVLATTLLGGPVVSPAQAAKVPEPEVTPIAGDAGKGHPVSGAEGIVDLPALGYRESEFLLSGEATTYREAGNWQSDGKWATEVESTGNPYTTRMFVETPSDPAKFNGTVIVEWLNVSFGVDIPVDLSQSYRRLSEDGYAYVGVTVQKTGADKLSSLDPARYPGVSISDDALSYDIFSQVGQAVRANPNVLGGLEAKTVLGTGHSQSAMRLTTYANAIQPVDDVYDGILLHGRAAMAAPIGDGLVGPLEARIRTDLQVPVFILQAETDILLSQPIRQDTARVRTWEIAESHADQYGLNLYNAANARDGSINGGDPTYCDKPVNDMTFRYAENAAITHLSRWARGGAAPPTAEPISTSFGLVKRDEDGNALGGVRLPDLEVPIATHSPNNSGGNVPGACVILGTTTPLTVQRINELYPDHDSYVAEFVNAADRARDAGYLLPEDYEEAIAAAKARDIP